MAVRKYFKSGIAQLQDLVAQPGTTLATLRDISAELKHRSTNKAAELEVRVQRLIAKMESTPAIVPDSDSADLAPGSSGGGGNDGLVQDELVLPAIGMAEPKATPPKLAGSSGNAVIEPTASNAPSWPAAPVALDRSAEGCSSHTAPTPPLSSLPTKEEAILVLAASPMPTSIDEQPRSVSNLELPYGTNMTPPMSEKLTRLQDILVFARESAKLRSAPPTQVAQHKQFAQYEDAFVGLPGVALNPEAGDDELWLSMERLGESQPETPKDKLLALWIQLSGNPATPPTLKNSVLREELLEGGFVEPTDAQATVSDETCASEAPEEGRAAGSKFILLEDFNDAELVRRQLDAYMKSHWEPWAAREKLVRRSIALYGKLFLLHQQLQGNMAEAQLELVMGVGIALWKHKEARIQYPVLTQSVEMSLNENTMAIEIRPRLVEPRLELDIYSAMDNPGVPDLQKFAKQFLGKLDKGINPFEKKTFDQVLLKATGCLSESGRYWPQINPDEDDRTVPNADETLKITDGWVLFARPRSSSSFILDIERFEQSVEGLGAESKLPGAVNVLVTDPSNDAKDPELPAYRGLSMVGGSSGSTSPAKPRELYFPLPFNDEQVSVIQLLDVSDGVVVQGPPGSGKTHTIANIICHTLAMGQRVLVTSSKDPALAVLRDKLPEEIRPLAISLLSSEAEGMKEFEHSIEKISSTVSSIDRRALRKEIESLESQIDATHGALNRTDHEIAQWALKNLASFDLDGHPVHPREAAAEVVQHLEDVAWFPDVLGIEPKFNPQFQTEDILAIRDARYKLGEQLCYIGLKLPALEALPQTAALLEAHANLQQLHALKAQESDGEVPSLCDASQQTIERVIAAHLRLEELGQMLRELAASHQDWHLDYRSKHAAPDQEATCAVFEQLRGEVREALNSRTNFIAKPVSIPASFEANEELYEAIQRLAQGKKAFGFAAWGKSALKDEIAKVTVTGTAPADAETWAHVLRHLELHRKVQRFVVRWNALSPELSLPLIEDGGVARLPVFDAALKACDLIERHTQLDAQLRSQVKALMPAWDKGDAPLLESEVIETHKALSNHIQRHKLGATWAVREDFRKALAKEEDAISADLASFLDHMLGSPDVSDAQLQARWSELCAQLRALHEQRPLFNTVERVAGLIEASGAPMWADRLRKAPVTTETTDPWLQGDCSKVWRWARMSAHMDAIDGREALKRLGAQRRELESDLARFYRQSVSKRTWLRLAEKAGGRVMAALEAYRNSIRRIGRGTGIRAQRYRQDARMAAEQANDAIPCWIMPHYRISESLPSEMGCFDLVIIDEASQSDLMALPALLRAKKILIVGDDKQVSPEGVGLAEEKIRSLMGRYLSAQVPLYKPQMSPDRSIYDLFKVIFADATVMLKEHFRCVAPIIEYSKREFYHHQLKPLRLPRASERMDPPLVDIRVIDGYREKDINKAEAQYIFEEIERLVADPANAGRTIGVVSLHNNEQAFHVMERLNSVLDEETITRFEIACGDARTFQGKERDIMFLSMVVSPGQATAQTKEQTAQRFNVAASRARDRMYLVRSIDLEELSSADIYRASLIKHFESPFAQNEEEVENLRDLCESPFEREVYDELTERGYKVTPQVEVGTYRIDMVVEGKGDSRLAIECDGDKYHGPDKWEDDMRRQRTLERAGWRFWRCFASTFVSRRKEVMDDLVATLASHDIHPAHDDTRPRSPHSIRDTYHAYGEQTTENSKEAVL